MVWITIPVLLHPWMLFLFGMFTTFNSHHLFSYITSKNNNPEIVKISLYCCTHLMHRGAPEIIKEQIWERCVRSQITILLNCTNIIKHEITVTTVVVTNQASQYYYSTQCVVERHFSTVFANYFKNHFRIEWPQNQICS